MLLVATFIVILPLVCNAVAVWYPGDRETVLKSLETIETTVNEIRNHVKEQDRFKEIKDLLQIDSTLKKLQEQNEELKNNVISNQGALGRSGGESESHHGLERRLDNLQENVLADVKGSMQKIEEVQNSASETKRDLDKKLGKMMNIMTSLYEAKEKESSSKTGDESSSVFLTEYMDVMEQRLKEELSVVSTRLHGEMKAMERAVSSILDETQGIASRMEGVQTKQNIQVMVESALLNLTRRERAVETKLQERIQALEKALLHKSESTTEIATSTEPATTTCKDMISGNITQPKSCWELYRAGAGCNGVYIIYPQGKQATYVYCDMTGGGWTLLMRRGDFEEKTDFHRDWNTYKEGFGDLKQEFWLGNENIHLLTTEEEVILHVHLEDFHGDVLDAEYEPFSVASESENYKLHIGTSKTLPPSMASSLRYHNGKPFSTRDRNNDTPKDDCPGKYRGGWWFNRCHYVLLTAPYYRQEEIRHKWQGIQWHSWKGTNVMKVVELKIKPKHEHKHHQRKNSRFRAIL